MTEPVHTHSGVSEVDSVREASSDHKSQHVEWNQVDEEHIASP